jgi:hypothetical protein
VILKLFKKTQAWGDERIKKVVVVLAAEGIKNSKMTKESSPMMMV